jgi:hypothetical protein
MKAFKVVLAIIVLAVAGQLQAAIVDVPIGDGNYVYDTLIHTSTTQFPADPWEGNPIQQQDKLWTYVSSSTSLGNAPVHFELVISGGIEYHEIKLADNVGNYRLEPGTYTLHYTIQVTDSQRAITEVSLAVDGRLTAGVDIVKTLRESAEGPIVGILHSTGGPVDIGISPSQFLDVVEVINVSDGAYINSTTNTYKQALVPEPVSLIVWSLLGATGMAIVVWRKRKSA